MFILIKYRFSLTLFVFCSHKLQAVSLSILSIASSSPSSSSLSSFSLSWDHLAFPSSCCLEILTDLDRHTLGSAGSLLSSASLSPHIYISVNLDDSLCLLLIISCVLTSSTSPWWTGGHVARAPLGDVSSCSVVYWIQCDYDFGLYK